MSIKLPRWLREYNPCRPKRITLIHITLRDLEGPQLNAAYQSIAGKLSGVEAEYAYDHYNLDEVTSTTFVKL